MLAHLLVHILDVERERWLAKVCVHDFAGRLQSHGRIQFGWQIAKGDAQIGAVVRVEASIVHHVNATADNVARGKGWPVRLSRSWAREGVAVVAMIAVRLFIPARQAIHLEVLRRQSDAHVAISTLRDDLHLEIVQATGGRNWMGCSHRCGIIVRLANSCPRREKEKKNEWDSRENITLFRPATQSTAGITIITDSGKVINNFDPYLYLVDVLNQSTFGLFWYYLFNWLGSIQRQESVESGVLRDCPEQIDKG